MTVNIGALDTYKIPLIIAYPGYQAILNVDVLINFWPQVIAERINNADTEAIHIAFTKDCIFNAIDRFYVNAEKIITTGKRISNGD